MANGNIYQGDNGTILRFTISDENGIVSLNEVSSIQVKIKNAIGEFYKNCTVTDAVNGRCETILLSSDLSESGNYALQLIVNFTDGKSFKSSIGKFPVAKSL